ncbi:hypothetical protein DO70_5293 [Burkholderia pseudomallei]|nr:hypothetical protein DO70_5293 [Burkholderia pseudomallei]
MKKAAQCAAFPKRAGGAPGAYAVLPLRRDAAAAVFAAFVATAAAALKFVSAISTACFAAFCTVSYVVFAALIADFSAATAVSEPAGAFFATLSTSACTLRFCSSYCASATFANSACVADAISYT